MAETKFTDEQKREQIIDQCKVIDHLASVIAGVHRDLLLAYKSPHLDEAFLDFIGPRLFSRMELLGDVLNGMDAVSEDDDWVNPTFGSGREIWAAALSKARGEA